MIGCAVLVGLAFNTKTLAALLIVPGIALAYVACAPARCAADWSSCSPPPSCS